MANHALRELLNTVPDKRHHNVQHSLTDILIISVFAMVAGVDHFTDFELFGNLRLKWFRTMFGIEKVPSHDTFSVVFRTLDYRSFELALRTWTAHLLKDSVFEEADVVSIDGKALNGSSTYTNIVSAWSNQHGVTLGGVSTEGSKQNELHAMVRLVQQLRLKDAIVTADAAGTYAVLVDAICEKGADYALPVKDNQSSLVKAVDGCFKAPSQPVQTFVNVTKTSNRIEERVYELMPLSTRRRPEFAKDWRNLKAVGRVTSTVTVHGIETVSVRQFITSLAAVKTFAHAVRSHWGVENALHWQLDVVFKEDNCPARDANAQKNLNTVRKLVLNTLNKLKTEKLSVSRMRKQAAWSEVEFEKLASKFLRG